MHQTITQVETEMVLFKINLGYIPPCLTCAITCTWLVCCHWSESLLPPPPPSFSLSSPPTLPSLSFSLSASVTEFQQWLEKNTPEQTMQWSGGVRTDSRILIMPPPPPPPHLSLSLRQVSTTTWKKNTRTNHAMKWGCTYPFQDPDYTPPHPPHQSLSQPQTRSFNSNLEKTHPKPPQEQTMQWSGGSWLCPPPPFSPHPPPPNPISLPPALSQPQSWNFNSDCGGVHTDSRILIMAGSLRPNSSSMHMNSGNIFTMSALLRIDFSGLKMFIHTPVGRQQYNFWVN